MRPSKGVSNKKSHRQGIHHHVEDPFYYLLLSSGGWHV